MEYVHRWIKRVNGQLDSGIICCDTPEGNRAWRERLTKLGINYFMTFHEKRSRYALSFGRVDVYPESPVRVVHPRPNLFKNPGYDLVNM